MKPIMLLSLLLLTPVLSTKAAEEFIRSRRQPRQHRRLWPQERIDIERSKNKTLIICNSTMVNQKDLDSLAYAVSKNDHERVALLLQRGRYSPNGIAGLSLEQYARMSGYTKTVEVLDTFYRTKIDALKEKKYSEEDT